MFLPFFFYMGIALFCVYVPLHVWGSRKMKAKPRWDGCRGFSMIPSNLVGILMVASFAAYVHWALLPAILLIVIVLLALAAFTDVLG